MSLLTERSQLILRFWWREIPRVLRRWWRSRRWVRRRIIRQHCRRFIPLDGAHDEAITLSNAPGAIIVQRNKRTFPTLVVPSREAIKRYSPHDHHFENGVLCDGLEPAGTLPPRRFLPMERLIGFGKIVEHRAETAAPAETEFERNYLKAMRPRPTP